MSVELVISPARENIRLRVLGNRVQRMVFESNGGEITGGRIKLQHNFNNVIK
jgi:hypothetical protein